MKEEQTINNRFGTATCFVYSGEEIDNRNEQSSFAVDDVIKKANEQTQVIPFPFDKEVNPDNTKVEKENTHSEHTHGAKLSMISAIVHMKRMALRKRRDIREKINEQSFSFNESESADKTFSGYDASNATHDDVTDEDPWHHVRNCRYLRGVKEDQELTIKEIFS